MRRFRLMLILPVALVVASFCSTGVASADSLGQCNNFAGNVLKSTSAWLTALGNEGVTSQSTSMFFKPAGYVSVDQTLHQWVAQRVMKGAANRPFSAMDYGCHDGQIFSAGPRSYPTGKTIFYVLPKKYDKSDVSTSRTKAFIKAIVVKVMVIGLPDCGNNVKAYAFVTIYVKKTIAKKVTPTPKPKPKAHKPKPAPAIVCSAGFLLAANGNCVQQSITSTQTCGNGQVMSTTGCVSIDINNNCGNLSINGSPTQGGNCNTCVGINVCNQAPPPPSCPTGQTGSPPNCSTPCTSNCSPPPPPPCTNGTVGTPPNCQCPTGTEAAGKSCQTPPTAILQKFQEVDVNGTDVAKATANNVPVGDSVQYCFSSAGLGDFPPSCVVSSTGSAESTYTAGSETGSDQVCVAITDLTTGYTNATQDSSVNASLPDYGKDCQPVTIQSGDPSSGRPS
jgi:hypothetical protein